MRVRLLLPLTIVLSLLGIALSGKLAPAQTATSSLPGPLACFVRVQSTIGLDSANAERLCMGAADASPAHCFEGAQRLGAFTMYQSVQLCVGATSTDPVGCAQEVREAGALTAGDTVSYCAALHWPLVRPSNGGASVCLDQANNAGLSNAQALDVCRGSTSTAPADCVERGRDLTGLADADLVDLCTSVVPYPVLY
jgi:hypothetical protein